MEINKYTDITGVVTTEAIVEGRMVLYVGHSETHDFGSREDLTGVKLPDTQDEAARSHFVITWPVDNTKPPLYYPYPSYAFSLRQGWDQATNMPFNADVTMIPYSMTTCKTIPSGYLALAFGPGVFTVPSGCYIYSANMEVPGTWLEVANTAEDGAGFEGMLMEDADGSEGKFAQVERFNDTTGALTFRL